MLAGKHSKPLETANYLRTCREHGRFALGPKLRHAGCASDEISGAIFLPTRCRVAPTTPLIAGPLTRFGPGLMAQREWDVISL